MAKRNVSPKMKRARAYWRLSAKAFRAGQYNQADHYRKLAERLHAEFLREREYLNRIKLGKPL